MHSLVPPLSLDDYAGLLHVLVSLRGEPFGHVDELLAATGRRRTVCYTTPHFLAVPSLLRGLRAVAALPRRLAACCPTTAGLATCPVPLPSGGYDVKLVWHRRTTPDPAQRWLRNMVTEAAQASA